MKLSCLLVKNLNNAFDALDFQTANAFTERGYTFEELRAVSDVDENAVSRETKSLFEQTENLVVIAEKRLLSNVGKLVSDALNIPFTQKILSGAGVIEEGKKTVFLLSFESGESGDGYVKNVCIPYLIEKYANRYEKITLRAVGAGREKAEALIREARRMSGDSLRYNYKGRYGEDIVEITYDSSVPRMLTDDVLRLFADGLQDELYAMDDTPLEEQIVRLLKLHRQKLAVAESFTGGGVSARIVSVSGASEVYYEGLNTYAEDSKKRRLGVPEYVLKTQGAVSDETAYHMALGLLSDADISVATTGLAGPNADRQGNPVGLSYIAVGTREQIYVYKYRFDGSRKEITETAINYALFCLYKQIKGV